MESFSCFVVGRFGINLRRIIYMEFFPTYMHHGCEQWKIGFETRCGRYFFSTKNMFVYFVALAILRYTNSTRCGFMSTFVSLLNLCLDYFQVESCIRIATNLLIPSNSSKWSNSQRIGSPCSPCNKTTLLGYQNWSHPKSHQSSSNFMFSAKDGPHSSPPKEGKIIRTKMEASNLQTPGTGEILLQTFPCGQKMSQHFDTHSVTYLFSFCGPSFWRTPCLPCSTTTLLWEILDEIKLLLLKSSCHICSKKTRP